LRARSLPYRLEGTAQAGKQHGLASRTARSCPPRQRAWEPNGSRSRSSSLPSGL